MLFIISIIGLWVATQVFRVNTIELIESTPIDEMSPRRLRKEFYRSLNA
jgi:hypothetical protein